ncbi:hypothetical protein PQ610_00855 [Tardisphaera miroshnichenkoae]
MIWEGVLEFFAAGLIIGALVRKRPALLASVLLAVFILSLVVYVASPSLWESAWSGSYERLHGVLSYFYSSPFAYSLSALLGAALAFVAVRPRKKAARPAQQQQQPVKVKIQP